ncbi:MAG: hypothetical protein AAFO07_03375 [Bacteroidota bacterium]
MKTLMLALFFCLSFSLISNAQSQSNEEILDDILSDLQEQGVELEYNKTVELLDGIVRYDNNPCHPKAIDFSKFAQKTKGLYRPLQDQYWVSVDDRKRMLLVRRKQQSYEAYGVIHIVEQVDAYTYKSRVVFCHCFNCVDRSTKPATTYWCGVKETEDGFECANKDNRDCILIDQTGYFCGRVVYKQ